ncbi:nuclear pore complex subunit Nup159, partial [Stagonosporopsis vannaccii]
FVVPGPATLAQIEKERAEHKAREERELSERLAQSQGSEPRNSPTPSRLTPSRLFRTSLSADSPTSLKKSLDLFRPSPQHAHTHTHTPSRSHSARSSPVLARTSSHDPSPSLFRRQPSRELRPEYQRASMSFGFSQSASAPAPAPAVNAGADVPAVLTEEFSFKALSQGAEGPKKLKILPTPWPTDHVPPASVTLLSVASKTGLLAAAGPDTLVLAFTDRVRKAFQDKAGEWDVVSDFAPDATMPVPKLRHVAFSAEGDLLVISAEDGGGLAVFDPTEIMKQNFNPGKEIATDKQPVRVLLPNPTHDMEHIFAAVLDNGKLCLIDVTKGDMHTIREEGVVCASWSTKGKALAVGLKDGTGVLYLNNGTQKAVIPRPPKLHEGFTYSGLVWLANDEFFITHFPKQAAIDSNEPEEGRYHYVRSNKAWTSFSFHPTPEDPILPAWDVPTRAFPPRLSVTRLRNWEPDLDDLLILTNSHSDTIIAVTSASKELAKGGPINEYTVTDLNEGQGAQVPRRVFGEEGDSALVGEAIDLSATEKILRPISSNEEIAEAPHPLPVYMFLTHQGILSAYWVVWNRSIVEGKRYPGLVAPSSSSAPSDTPAAQKIASPSKIPTPGGTSNLFAKPATATFGAPSTPSGPKFGASPFTSTTQTASGNSAFGSTTPGASFGQPSQPSSSTPFGQPGKPTFGATSTMGSASPFSQPAGSITPAFGQASKLSGATAGSTQTAFGQPSKPTFGAASGPAFGAAGGLGKASPWGTASSQSTTPASNPFASKSGSSGFANLAQPASGGGTGFSFSNASGGQSGFANLAQQKSAFGGAANTTSTPGLKPEPSFGSTVTVGSNNGSTLPSFGTPSQQQSSSIFGQKTTNSSFATTSSFASSDSGADTQQRKRDEATPTPQPASGLNGLAGGFKLGTTFKADGSAKDDDPAKPAAPATGGFFGSDFSSMVPKAGLQAPKTPGDNGSTTPLSPPKKSSYFPGTTPLAPPPTKKEPVDDAPLPPDFTQTTKKPAPANDAPLPPDFTQTTKKPEPANDAPLPPDFITSKPKSQPVDDPLPPDFLPKKSSKPAEDDLPPLAGSPGVKVEVPSSSPEATPLDDDEDDEFSDEEEDEGDDEDDEEEDVEEEEEEEEEDDEEEDRPPPATLGKYVLQRPEGEDKSKQQFPPAPTPPVTKSEVTKTPLFGARPSAGQAAPTPLFGGTPMTQTTKSQPLFGQASQNAPFSLGQQAKPAQPSFPPPRAQTNLRSPSPVRSSSASSHRPTTRREPSAPGSSLSASFQQSKPPTPQPQVSDLEDQEDERIRAQLAQEIEPSRTLDDFVAHQKYAGTSAKTGHAAQIEAIYKDINGMVDALGWNARSIKSFTEYHKHPQPGHQVDRQTLEDAEADGKAGAWFEQFALSEISALKDLEDQLSKELDAGRVQDVHDKLVQLRRLILEKAKLMTRINDIRRQIINRKDPEKVESSRKAALPKELADTQKTLRADYAKLLTLLSQAEEAAILLRSRIASHSASAGNTSAVPSMDAVKKTIIKMTNLAERRNNDIALLESQMRKIGLQDPSRPTSSSSHANGATTPRRARGTDLRRSIADTPFVTPPTRGKMTLTELNRRALTPEVADSTPSKGYGLFYDAQESAGGNELAKLSDMVDDNIEELRQTARRRRTVANGLRKALLDRGVKTTSVI